MASLVVLLFLCSLAVRLRRTAKESPAVAYQEASAVSPRLAVKKNPLFASPPPTADRKAAGANGHDAPRDVELPRRTIVFEAENGGKPPRPPVAPPPLPEDGGKRWFNFSPGRLGARKARPDSPAAPLPSPKKWYAFSPGQSAKKQRPASPASSVDESLDVTPKRLDEPRPDAPSPPPPPPQGPLTPNSLAWWTSLSPKKLSRSPSRPRSLEKAPASPASPPPLADEGASYVSPPEPVTTPDAMSGHLTFTPQSDTAPRTSSPLALAFGLQLQRQTPLKTLFKGFSDEDESVEKPPRGGEAA